MFKFNLGQQVTVKVSGETGTVEGRAEYIEEGNAYYIHYRAADGRAVNTWRAERHIEPVTIPTTSQDTVNGECATLETLPAQPTAVLTVFF
ncbi:hypothetical protein I6H07_22490 [Hafnia alvei]|uniref:hypothetical protein n=1 Tax=Hafnia alvei TaxID=569 RepID=UPI000B716E94|nr:hypothetical protein [Hafnia alvei]MBI0277292.1 hypothetical protein [Hafnia alvei]MBI0278511.1 hypothetical protein [Hafnia alvei]PNK96245.1 hypothetical protein CEQ28_000850 [Hafnia alvei]PNK97579.1 hypothetical protein CEQ28_008235 [Hafnia alvei]